MPSLPRSTPSPRLRRVNVAGAASCCIALAALMTLNGTPSLAQPSGGSLNVLVDAAATKLETRARNENVGGLVRLTVNAGRGLSPARVDRVFTPRLMSRLARGGVLVPSARAGLSLSTVVSLERGQLWVVSVLEGDALEGPTSVAVSAQADRELLSVFGRSRTAPGAQWRTDRLGEIDSGVLDIVLMDTDSDFADEIVVLTVNGARVYRASVGDALVDPVRAAVPLPAPERGWPRVVAGWIAEAPAPEHTVWIATTAGHHLSLNMVTGALKTSHVGFVPLKGQGGESAQTLLARGGYGGPLLAPPLKATTGDRVRRDGLPARLRDAVLIDTGLLLNTETGVLAESRGTAPPTALARNDRVGDRIAVADFDADGTLDVATSSGAPPFAPDRFIISKISDGADNVLFQGTLSGGSVVGMAVGDIDLDEHIDLVIAEAAPDGVTLLWHVEHSP